MKTSVGIYIHSPFCGSKCGYCSFYSFPGIEVEKRSYLIRLEEDIIQGIHSLEQNYEYATVYFGGGTPSCFPASQVTNLIKKTLRSLTERSIHVQEVTVEVNPADYNREDLFLLRESGVTRLSIGIQSLIERDLTVMGRRHSLADAFQTVEFAVEAGFTTISADLMYGLPNQTFSQWQKGLEDLCKLGVNHISLYELTLEEGTPFFEKNIIDEDEDHVLEFLNKMQNFLQKNGFDRYEISNFSKGDNHRSLHNLNYWRQNDYLGFGPSAVSTIGDLRKTVTPLLKDYLEGNVKYEIDELTEKQLHFEKIMLGLRSSEGVSFDVIKVYQRNYLTKEEQITTEKSLQNFIEEKYFHKADGILSFTDKGFLLYNEIIGKIL